MESCNTFNSECLVSSVSVSFPFYSEGFVQGGLEPRQLQAVHGGVEGDGGDGLAVNGGLTGGATHSENGGRREGGEGTGIPLEGGGREGGRERGKEREGGREGRNSVMS